MCANSGTCRDEIETFTCMCPPEFTGELCETELDRYELQVTVNSFSNPEGMCADDTCLSNSGCCEGNIECPVSCNYYFSLCLRPVDTSLSEIRDVDQGNCSTFETEIQQVFSGATFRDSIFGTPNPLTLSGFNPEFLADGVQLYVELRDSDLTNSDELIDRFATNISIEVGEAESFTTTGKFGFAEMDITTRIVCAENFYGPLCETFCLENCTCPPGFTGEFCSNTNMADTTTTASTTTSLGTPGASTTTIIIAILAVLCVIAVAITMLVIVCSFVAGKRRRKSYRNYADLHQNVLKVDQNQWDWSLENSAKVFSSTSDSNSPLQTLESEYSKLEHVSEKPHSNGNTPHSLALALTSTSTSVSTPSSTQPLIRETSTNTYIREGSNDDTVFSPSPPPFFNAGANGRLGLTEEVDLASTTTTGGGSGPPRNDDSASYATAGSGTELSGNNDYAIADGGTENTGAGDGTEPSSRIESGHTTADSGIESGYTMAGTGTESGYTMAGGGIEPGYTMAGSTFDDSAYLGSYTNDDHYQYSPQTGEYDYESPYWKPSNERGKLLAEFKRLELRSITQGELEEKEVLGSGAFGTVYRGVWLHKEGEELVKEEEVAVKTLDNRASKRERIKFLQEAAIMGQFNHPNIVSILGVKVTADECKIVMELMTVGNFRSHLPTLKSSLSNQSELASQLLFYSRQVASGMNYLAVKGFVHRDLAARNILVSKNDVCKIADFGLSRALQEEDCYTSQGGKVPVKWTAPEAINYRTYSPASDVWSYGCVLYEIWSLGTKPFHDLANSEVMDKLVTGYRLPPPPGCPRAIYDIMIKCWNDDPKARPRSCSICTAINLPEFKVLKWSEEDLARYGEEARTIGAPLEAAEHVFAELQDTYKESAHQ